MLAILCQSAIPWTNPRPQPFM